jgi:hypothetical protein
MIRRNPPHFSTNNGRRAEFHRQTELDRIEIMEHGIDSNQTGLKYPFQRSVTFKGIISGKPDSSLFEHEGNRT